MRRLSYLVVETGRCEHCHRDAGEHSVEGLCHPLGHSRERHPNIPEPAYRGKRAYAFVETDRPHEPEAAA